MWTHTAETPLDLEMLPLSQSAQQTETLWCLAVKWMSFTVIFSSQLSLLTQQVTNGLLLDTTSRLRMRDVCMACSAYTWILVLLLDCSFCHQLNLLQAVNSMGVYEIFTSVCGKWTPPLDQSDYNICCSYDLRLWKTKTWLPISV